MNVHSSRQELFYKLLSDHITICGFILIQFWKKKKSIWYSSTVSLLVLLIETAVRYQLIKSN